MNICDFPPKLPAMSEWSTLSVKCNSQPPNFSIHTSVVALKYICFCEACISKEAINMLWASAIWYLLYGPLYCVVCDQEVMPYILNEYEIATQHFHAYHIAWKGNNGRHRNVFTTNMMLVLVAERHLLSHFRGLLGIATFPQTPR